MWIHTLKIGKREAVRSISRFNLGIKEHLNQQRAACGGFEVAGGRNTHTHTHTAKHLVHTVGFL